MTSPNECCIGAGINPSGRFSGAGVWRSTDRIKSQVSCVHRRRPPAECGLVSGRHPRLEISLENRRRKKREGGGVPHPDVGARSACQYQLSCCIFYEKSPVAYSNIYRHLKIGKPGLAAGLAASAIDIPQVNRFNETASVCTPTLSEWRSCLRKYSVSLALTLRSRGQSPHSTT